MPTKSELMRRLAEAEAWMMKTLEDMGATKKEAMDDV